MTNNITWFAPGRGNTRAACRLFCIPHVGGTASAFRGWDHALFDIVEVCPVQLPGREKRLREKPFSDLMLLVQAIADVLPTDKPYALFGHSMGALLTFELAREMRRRRMPVPFHLFLSAYPAPDSMVYADPPLHTLPDAEFIEKIRRLNGTPEQILQDASMMEMLLPMLRADYCVVETYAYQPEAPLHCPITAFGGDQDPDAPHEKLVGWRKETAQSFALKIFPGNHFFLFEVTAQILGQVSRTIEACLTKTYEPQSTATAFR
jgi:medium-chain acyl-[acyl-carrier-protein] hydrolase